MKTPVVPAPGVVPVDLRACLAALLPAGAGVGVRRAPFAEPALLEGEDEAAQRMAPHRRREFGAGRDAAREALAQLGLPPVALPRTVGRGPRWPEGIVGSITHTNDFALAAAARRAGGLIGLGIDVERIDRVDGRLVERIATPDEIARLGRGGDAAAERALLFAARECVHKCWAPATEEQLVFADVGVVVVRGTFSIVASGGGARPVRRAAVGGAVAARRRARGGRARARRARHGPRRALSAGRRAALHLPLFFLGSRRGTMPAAVRRRTSASPRAS